MAFLAAVMVCMLALVLSKWLLYWRKVAGDAFYAAARYSPTRGERIRYARQGVLAGNDKAGFLYVFSLPDSFSDHCPNRIFSIKKVPCIFSGYYFPSRFWKYLPDEQVGFTKNVLAFKEGMYDDIDFFKNGIAALKPDNGTVIMFMPCSAWWKYWVRFRKISEYIDSHCPHLINGFYYYKYLGERNSLHLQKERSKTSVERNFEIVRDLTDKNIIIVDDVTTTGHSLKQIRKDIKAKGGRLTGAIFLAGTFAMPGKLAHSLLHCRKKIQYPIRVQMKRNRQIARHRQKAFPTQEKMVLPLYLTVQLFAKIPP